jgi:glycosyltransferase involved in cell wall biosynthesis
LGSRCHANIHGDQHTNDVSDQLVTESVTDPVTDPVRRPRLAIVADHPTQHFGPWFRAVEEHGGVELLVLYQSAKGAEAYADRDFGSALAWDVPVVGGYRHEVLRSRRRRLPTMFLRDDNPWTANSLRLFDPDVVLVFGYARSSNWRAARWATRHRRPLLLCCDSSATAPVTALRGAVKRVVLRRFYRRLSGALCNSESNRQYHQRYGLEPAQLYPCRLPVDLVRLQAVSRTEARDRVRTKYGIPRDAFVALFCGKFVAHKRAGDLVHALADPRLAEPGQSESGGTWALLVGDGPLRADLETLAASGPATCRFTGFVNQSSIGDVYAAADVLVQPSSLEAHGLSMTEGCALGLPLVVSNAVGGIGEDGPAQPGRNALVYSCGDVEALCDALVLLRDDPIWRATLGAASERIADDHGAARAADLLHAAVVDVVGARAAHQMVR